jgi:voltage-gated potassium channel
MADVMPAEELVVSRRRAVRRILAGLTALLSVILFGIAGYVVLGDWSVADALFMVVITVSGVGFGEVRALDTPWLRAHTMLVILLGIVAMGWTVTGILGFVTEEEIQRLLGHQRVRRHIETLRGHTVVAGFGRMGSLICAELAAAGVPFVLIEKSGERMGEVERRGWLYMIGDATEEKVLQDAGLERAKALVSVVPSDAANVFITLTARQMARDVFIVARAEQPSTQKKLIQAGANHVVLPAAIGAHRIVTILTNPSAVEFAELVTHRSSLAIELDEVAIREGDPFAGRTLRDADIGRLTGVMVIAIKRADGHVEFPPPGDLPLGPGDVIVLLGRRHNLDQFRKHYGG